MTNEEVSPSAEPPIRQPKPTNRSGFVWGLGLCLWGGLTAASIERLPRFRNIFLDFGTKVPAACAFLLQYGLFLIPAVGTVACWIAYLVNDRWARSILLIWLPLLLGAAIVAVVGLPLLKLLNDLS